ncbi:MAG TPA: transketolase [Gammaproteobacteria bacterium]|nr:transketolase [Gammaproteobacteria bacterium]
MLNIQLHRLANTVRSLAMDAVENAGSGHAGLPFGCAELGAYLFGEYLNLDNEDVNWPNRDIVVLSAGHGSIWLYIFLHLLNFGISLDDLTQYRSINSQTPSHPEFGKTPGIDATTGTDGQGVGFAVGYALAYKILAAKFNTPDYQLFNNKILVLAGDGCMMEGISGEASSFAGHLGLNNLILIYDSNKTSLDGFVSETMSENIELRYKAYGWDVFEIDGHDFDAMHNVFKNLRTEQKKPTLIIANTVIGKGLPNVEGTPLAHSGSLDHEYVAKIKQSLGLNSKFAVPHDVYEYFNTRIGKNQLQRARWQQLFTAWQAAHPELACEYNSMQASAISPDAISKVINNIPAPASISGRAGSNMIVNVLADALPALFGGSADLARSDGTFLHKFPILDQNNFAARNIKYGVREFTMASVAAGLALSKHFIPYIGTFLAFSDYMKNAIRLTAMMKIRVIYQFTHDSFLIGEDGPTHQPVEQIVNLRAIPNLRVIRPADFYELQQAWIAALNYSGPTALILSRQELKTLDVTSRELATGVAKGAYIVVKENAKCPEIILIATGSELELALEVASQLRNRAVRVISMPCWEIFDLQSEDYKNQILCKNNDIIRVSIEAGSAQGWHKYIGLNGLAISLDHFGESGAATDLKHKFGFTTDSILKKITKIIEERERHVVSTDFIA